MENWHCFVPILRGAPQIAPLLGQLEPEPLGRYGHLPRPHGQQGTGRGPVVEVVEGGPWCVEAGPGLPSPAATAECRTGDGGWVLECTGSGKSSIRLCWPCFPGTWQATPHQLRGPWGPLGQTEALS